MDNTTQIPSYLTLGRISYQGASFSLIAADVRLILWSWLRGWSTKGTSQVGRLARAATDVYLSPRSEHINPEARAANRRKHYPPCPSRRTRIDLHGQKRYIQSSPILRVPPHHMMRLMPTLTSTFSSLTR
ncbi:hypothetical protein TcWFU_004977 [Taenia crassiceps]|uniref:Uncharacterized protein n=1 Tax=Taenia crassiceps TaxID=6207 RepID=A0ABR4QB04_9CEST